MHWWTCGCRSWRSGDGEFLPRPPLGVVTWPDFDPVLVVELVEPVDCHLGETRVLRAHGASAGNRVLDVASQVCRVACENDGASVELDDERLVSRGVT